MIVSCPNCVTKYNLPDDKVPADGIKVKCSKCSHLFKVQPPAATPEEEVEVLLDDTNDTEPEQDQSSDFDAAFEEAVAGGGDLGGDDDDLGDESDDLDDMDFGDFGADDDAGDADDAGDDDLSDMDFGEDDSSDDFDDSIDDLDDDSGDDDDFGIDDDDDEDFGLGDDDNEDMDLNLGGDDDDGGLFASLDEDEDKGKKKSGLGKLLLTLLLALVLIVVLAVATLSMRLWSLPQSVQDSLPFDISMITGGDEADGDMAGDMGEMSEEEQPTQPMGDPTERVKEIKPVDFNQYVIGNEVEGSLYVIEGEALNNSSVAKKNIKVLVQLFDIDGNEMASNEVLCGNTLSLFQIQVDDRATIEENLTSSRGINLNNSYIKPGETTPFMVVFYDIQQDVETFKITISDAMDATRE